MRIYWVAWVVLLSGCMAVKSPDATAPSTGLAPPPPPPPPIAPWYPVTPVLEAEYDPFLKPGTGCVEGQAQVNLSKVPSNGVTRPLTHTVTLDPATSVGMEWWDKTSQDILYHLERPPSPCFVKARRAASTDAEGRFKFSNLPAGNYYVRCVAKRVEDLFEPGPDGRPVRVKGGHSSSIALVGELVTVNESQTNRVILNRFVP